ncbi:DUF2975 domain-containing protein [uncultured Polaribacter sp.]|uniref:DUF2975 domain-containing protein n=1 Tax=uncultured Polaribacter sp. TaxID=174711 RepID=UPI00260FEE06|nr:DUF2975 domain-containing protein [uncultured Polaribacter sp.]
MRKLNILKTIVDIIFIITIPLMLSCIAIAIGVFFIDFTDLSFIDIELIIDSENYNPKDLFSNILISISTINYLLLIAAFYIFRKVLYHFLRVKIFEDYVINSFLKIGNLIIISAIISIVLSFVSNLYYYKSGITFEIGSNENVMNICLGLFFLVLSEIFKIAKNAKQENDLTI